MIIKELIEPETLEKLERLKRECEEREANKTLSNVRPSEVVSKEGVGEGRNGMRSLSS